MSCLGTRRDNGAPSLPGTRRLSVDLDVVLAERRGWRSLVTCREQAGLIVGNCLKDALIAPPERTLDTLHGGELSPP